MMRKYNWRAFSIGLATIGLMYLAAYLIEGLSTWWAVPVMLFYAGGAGAAWPKGGEK